MTFSIDIFLLLYLLPRTSLSETLSEHNMPSIVSSTGNSVLHKAEPICDFVEFTASLEDTDKTN